MGRLLSGSAVWRMLCAVGAFFSAAFRGSRLNQAVGCAWKNSALRGWFRRRLDAQDGCVQSSRTTCLLQSLNDWLSRRFRLKDTWSASCLHRCFSAIACCGRESRLLGWLFRRGVTGLLLTLLGVYVLIDYTLRELLTVPLLSSVWDELLILFALFWIVWGRMGRKEPVRTRANPLDLPVFAFFCVGLALMCVVGSYPSIQLDGYRATVEALRRIVKELKEEGYTFVTVRELIEE